MSTNQEGQVSGNQDKSATPEGTTWGNQEVVQDRANTAGVEKDIKHAFEDAHEREENALGRAKEAFEENFPGTDVPAKVTGANVSANELKSRLNWGEPGLTILDVRDRDTFNESHIMGAMNTPMDILPESVEETLQDKRDIYVYANTDAEAMQAVQILQQAGFRNAAAIHGGLSAWQEIGGSIDGVEAATAEPGPGAYNVVSRLKEFADEQAKEKTI